MKKDKILYFISLAWTVVLILLLSPLLVLSHYNYPSADDWSHSELGYHALLNGEGVWGVIKGAIQTAVNSWHHVDAKFINPFLTAFQPGVWGEHFYRLTAWIIIGIMILCHLYIAYNLFGGFDKAERRKKSAYILPVILPVIAIEILYCPCVDQSFYWFAGGFNYTAMFCLCLTLLVVAYKLGIMPYPLWKRILVSVFAGILAFLVGGNSFSYSIPGLLILFMMESYFLWMCVKSRKEKQVDKGKFYLKAFGRVIHIPILMTAGLILVIKAPAVTTRLAAGYGGEFSMSPIKAIFVSLQRALLIIYLWTDFKMILLVFCVLPFLWRLVKDSRFSFKLPGVFTFLSYGIYASMMVANIYVDNNTGGGRQETLLFYGYILWLILNVLYWVGWTENRVKPLERLGQRIENMNVRRRGICLLVYSGFFAALLFGTIYVRDLKDISTYQAYRCLRQGWAQTYAEVWDARLEVLHDDSITDPVFEQLPVFVPLIEYTDLQTEDGYAWVTEACRSFYEKNTLTILPKQ